MDENKQIAQKIMSQASNWNFEGDCMILQLMQSIQKNLETRANNTIYSLDNLKTNINRAQIDLENTQNSLLALQYSQYVEMRCQEEAAFEVENVTTEQHQTQQQPTSQQEILENFLQNNIKMLHNCHDKFNFMEESDEDDNSATAVENCIYQPRNPYNERLLPHIYGTKMWKEQSHVGLEDDDLPADYSGDEKAEIYSISSTSSEGRESPESNIMTNTSQYTSNTSLSNEFNNANKIPKLLPSISNTPSVSSFTLDSSLRKYPSENLPNTATTTQAASALKKLTLNLFDDNDYKDLVSEIANKTQSLENSEKSTTPIQAGNSKIDLFANEDPLPIITSKIPTQNALQKQKVSNANLVRDPTEVSYDLFQDTSKPEPPKATTKLSARNLFDDDNDDEDFLNIFAKKTESTPVTKYTYQQSDYSTKPLFKSDDDEFDRQEVDEATAARNAKATDDTLANPGAHSIKRATKSLFFDDDDDDDDMDNDFFARKPVQSNVQKSLKQPKNFAFLAYLSTEPPLDTHNQQTVIADQNKSAAVEDEEIFAQKTLTQQFDDSQKSQKATTQNKSSFGIYFDADDKDDDLFGSKQVKNTTSIGEAPNIFAENKNTEIFDENIAKKEENEANKLINEGESSKMLTEGVKSLNVDIIGPKNGTSVEDFENVLGLENKEQDFEQPEVMNSKELANKPKSLEKIDVENPQTQTVVKIATGTLTESKAESTIFNTTNKAVDNNNETSSTVSENQSNLKKTDSSLKTTSVDRSAWLTEPPLDEENPESTAIKAFENETVDDFLSIFNKKKQTKPQVNDSNEKQKAPSDKKTAPHIEESTSESIEADIIDKIASKETEMLNENKSVIDVVAPETIQTAPQHKSSAFDHFSPLFLDEPPDDDDFLQAVSSSSKHNIGPATQFGAEHDFYESTKQNSQKTDTKIEENLPAAPASHTSYSIRLFDELPPDDNEQASVEDKKPNTLKNLFASDAEIFSKESTAQKFDQQSKSVTEDPADDEGNSAAKPKSQLLDNSHESQENRNHKQSISAEQNINSTLAAKGDILTKKISSPIPQQLDQQAKSVTAIVQAIEKPTIKQETIKPPTQNISKSNLPKININVQALLPNAAGPKSLKRNLEAEQQVDEVDRVQTLLPNAAGPKSLKRNLEADKQQVDEVNRENKTVHAETKTSPGNLHLLPNLNKTRVRVPVKRKISTRAARQEGYRRTLQSESNSNAFEDLDFNDKVQSTNSQRPESIAKKIEYSALEKPFMQPSMSASHQLTKDSEQISTETLPKAPISTSDLFSNIDDEEDEFFKDLSGNKTIKPTKSQLAKNINKESGSSPFEKPSMPTPHQLTKDSKQTPTETLPKALKKLTSTQAPTPASDLFTEIDDEEDDFFKDLSGNKTINPTKSQLAENINKESGFSSFEKPSMPTSHELTKDSKQTPKETLPKAPTKLSSTKVITATSALFSDNDDADDDFFEDLVGKKAIKPTELHQGEKAKEITPSPLQKTLVQPATTISQQPLAKAPTQPASTQVAVVASGLFSDNDDFFDQLEQPKLPTIAATVKKTVVPISEMPNADSDEDLFASNIAKVEKRTPNQLQQAASDQALILNKPASVTTKPISKKKALFDSDSSSENENVDNLFKASKTPKPTFQATPKAPTAVQTVKSNSSQNMQSKNTSLFSESDDDDDDDLFGSSSSKFKNSPSLSTATKNSSSTKQQQKKDTVPSRKATDNPLADLLE